MWMIILSTEAKNIFFGNPEILMIILRADK